MTAVLGISAYYHDAAAALVVDGTIVAAMQQERFSRRKNDPSLPITAAVACLEASGLHAHDLDRVVFYEEPQAKLERIVVSLLRAFPRSCRQFPRALGSQVGSKLWVLPQLIDALDVPRERVVTATHHLSHAASAFFPSPFQRAAVLTVDGVGEDITTGVWLGEGNEITPLASIEYPHSIGLFYAALTAYLGFEVNDGEYKVMGLAAFGTPSFREEFAKLIAIHRDGSFELTMPYFAFHTDTEIGFGPKLEALLGPRRPPHRPWDLAGSAEDRRYADVAATLQAVTEDALLAIAAHAKARTGADALCLAGGVALNCVANARLLREGGFARMFVQPAAGDAGGALGAAVLGAIELDGKRPGSMNTAALGRPVSNDVVLDLATRLGVDHTRPNDVFGRTAELIADGGLVGFARGRFEWGPRALGQRSILAAPQDPATGERLNRVVKRREPFRPFAPAVLRDRAEHWFGGCDNDMAPFMTTVGEVRSDRRSDLGAVTHVDGTARVQTVTETSAPDLFAILEHLDDLTGIPVVLNTSLNGNGEPIVGSETDALTFFMSHPVDAMVVGDVLLQRRTHR
jgi:carbamoyltransferase